MRFKLFMLALLYSACIMSSPCLAAIDMNDDVSLDWLLGDEFKSEKKKRSEQEKEKKKKEKEKKQDAQAQAESDAKINTDNTSENTSESISKIQIMKKQNAETGDISPAEPMPVIKRLPIPDVDLLTKVRKGASFTPEEVEYWLLNTPDVNTCYENGQTMLLYLVSRYQDNKSLNLLIENGADIQTHCTPRYEALFIAAVNNSSPEIIETLINNGANVVDRDNEKNTALILAATFNPSAKVIDTLIDYGLKTDTVNKYGYNALILAAYENDSIPVLQALLDNQADVNFKDEQGHTPLMAAAIRGRDDVMRYLITRGADFKAVDNNGVSVLDYYNKRFYLEKFSFNDEDLNSPSEKLSQQFKFITEKHHLYNNQLKQALRRPNPDAAIVEALENLATVDATDDENCTMLINAIRNNNRLSVVKTLVNAKANVNAQCQNGKNALMFLSALATKNRNVEEQITKAQYLLDNGLDINATDDDGNTALMHAIKNRADSRFVLMLIKEKANINALNNAQDSALWLILKQQDSPDNLKLLLEYGADPNQKNLKKETPLWYQLHQNGNDVLTQILLQSGADANTPNAAGELPLWYAFNKKAPVLVLESIILAQNDINRKNENGDTPLLYAVKNEYPAIIIKALLAKGADPEIPDRNGLTMYNILQSSQFFDAAVKRVTRDRVTSDW